MRSIRSICAGRSSPSLRDDSGTTLVEFAITLALFLLLFFGLIDFARFGFSHVMAEKAMQRAAWIATVRPPACAGVPEVNERGTVAAGTLPPEFGTSCSADASVCADAGTVTCTGDAANATASEIWSKILPLLPNDATLANVRFSYSYDPDLGFLGGPYVPVVTTELEDLTFQFVSPLGALAVLAGASDGGDVDADVSYPPMSVSLPGEDLAHGVSG